MNHETFSLDHLAANAQFPLLANTAQPNQPVMSGGGTTIISKEVNPFIAANKYSQMIAGVTV